MLTDKFEIAREKLDPHYDDPLTDEQIEAAAGLSPGELEAGREAMRAQDEAAAHQCPVCGFARPRRDA